MTAGSMFVACGALLLFLAALSVLEYQITANRLRARKPRLLRQRSLPLPTWERVIRRLVLSGFPLYLLGHILHGAPMIDVAPAIVAYGLYLGLRVAGWQTRFVVCLPGIGFLLSMGALLVAGWCAGTKLSPLNTPASSTERAPDSRLATDWIQAVAVLTSDERG